MNIQELLAKLAKGEALTAEESAFVSKHIADSEAALELAKIPVEKEEVNEGSKNKNTIPLDRLNEEIGKRKTVEEEMLTLQTKLKEIQDRDLSEQEKTTQAYEAKITELSSQLTEVTGERDVFKGQSEKSAFELDVHRIADTNATGNRFGHPDYLAMMLQKDGIDIKDAEVVGTYMKGLEESKPAFFMTAVKPGAGINPGDGESTTATSKKLLEMNDSEKVAYQKKIGKESYQKQLQTELTAT